MIKLNDCDFCKHSKGSKKGHVICDAFPDGVSYEFQNKDLKNMKECNNGVGYEAREDK
jgi:hypothetical protein